MKKTFPSDIDSCNFSHICRLRYAIGSMYEDMPRLFLLKIYGRLKVSKYILLERGKGALEMGGRSWEDVGPRKNGKKKEGGRGVGDKDGLVELDLAHRCHLLLY